MFVQLETCILTDTVLEMQNITSNLTPSRDVSIILIEFQQMMLVGLNLEINCITRNLTVSLIHNNK